MALPSPRGLRPILLILLAPVLVRVPAWVAGLDGDPIWTAGYMTAPGSSFLLRGLSGYLDLNAGWTTEALGGLAAHDWLTGHIPWWNPYAGIGMPLAAEMQSSAFFLPFILLLALPRGLMLLTISLQWTAGLATWRLLRRLDVPDLAATAGALLFELSASFAWLGPPPMLPVAFLPLFLLGIEHARGAALHGTRGGWRLISLSVALSLYAGFPETAYLDGQLALLWAIQRCATLPTHRAAMIRRVIGGGIVGLMLAAPLLWTFFDLLPHSNIVERTSAHLADVTLPPGALAQTLLPYSLGLPAQFSPADPSGRMELLWGRSGFYIGSVLALAALLGAIHRGPHRALRWVLLAWVALLLARIAGFPGATLLFRLMPFHDDIEVFRYAGAAILLPCCVLASTAINAPLRPRAVWLITACLAGAALTAAVVAWPLVADIPQAPAYLCLSAVAGIAALAACAWLFAHGKPVATVAVLLAESATSFMIPELAGKQHARIDRPAITFLQQHLGLQRFATIGPIQPNYGALFGIASVNHNVLPAPDLWSDYVAGHLRPGGSLYMFVGNYPPDAAGKPTNAQLLAQHVRDYANLGVRYVVAPATEPLFGAAPAAPTGPRDATMLQAGHSLTGQVPTEPGSVIAAAISIGTYVGRATGPLVLELCGQTDCVRGEATVAGAIDNAPLYIPLRGPLSARGSLQWTLSHPSGEPVAIWQWPGVGPQLTLFHAPGDKPTLVYADPVMDIYELPNPSAYWSTPNDFCDLNPRDRETIEATCTGPTTLTRRELAWPGWDVSVDGDAYSPVGRSGLFQTTPLPAGTTLIRFRYRPPGYKMFLMLFGLGVVLFGSALFKPGAFHPLP